MTAGVLEREGVAGSGLGFGSRARDTEAGQARQAREINRLKDWCERNGVPFQPTETPCPRGTSIIEVEEREIVGATSGADVDGGGTALYY
jgi:hypothetical protein